MGVLWKNQIIQFAKPDNPIFTEKTYAQRGYQKWSRAFLGLIGGVGTLYLNCNKDRMNNS
jgi:hypothetical protein